jgi:hypothetical protein
MSHENPTRPESFQPAEVQSLYFCAPSSFVYIRPTEQALRRSGAEGRDKDTKPVFVDLESYLFLEIFYRWVVKAG